MRVVLLTHVFPRAADDPLGAFLLHLTQQLESSAQVLVVAPHAAGLSDQATFGAVQVRRFHYAPDAQETLAYTGVMHEQVSRGIGGKFAFARFCYRYFRAARAAVRSFHPDVIHAHWWLPGGLIGALVSKWTRTPLVVTTHGTDVEQLRRAAWSRPLARFAFRQARIITCGSAYLRDRLIELNVAPPEKIQVIPMPVNPLFVTNQSPFSNLWSPVSSQSAIENRKSKIEILSVSRLTRQKNLDILLDALALLHTRGVTACLKIVGDGDQRAALETKTRDLNLQSSVDFMGMRPQTELPALYQSASIFVLPSVREGMGLVLAEALLCGVPVIATNSGGIPDIVHDGETGLLFPAQDAPALANAMQKYISDPAYAQQLAQNGRAYVLAHYAPAPVAAQFFQTYEIARAA